MSFDLPQKITFWAPTANNGTGGKTFASGIVVDARIAEVNETFFTPEGKTRQANKAVYARTAVPLGAYLIEGEHDGAARVEGSQLVIKSSSNVSITDMNRMLL